MKLGDVAKSAKSDYWVIPRYWDFIQYQRNLEHERDALQKIMTRPPRVRINTFSASAAGRCLRERQLGYMGAKRTAPDEQSMNIFANGDYVHLRHQVAGYVGQYIAGAEVSVAVPELNLTGTMDGVLTNGHGLEIKSINTRGFEEVSSFGPKADHKEQTNSYMLADESIEAFHIVYENKNDQRLKEFVVHRDPHAINRVREELLILNEATEAQVMLPMLPECVEGKGRFKRCQYRKSCPLAQFASAASRPLPIRVVSSTPKPSSE